MKLIKEFDIPFKGLKEGEHSFDFKINNTFLKNFGEEPENGELSVKVILANKPNFLKFDFYMNGFVSVPCDRCLDEINIDIDKEASLIIKFGEKYIEEEEDLIIIPESESSFNLASIIYELIITSIPFRNIHQNKEHCNKETIKKLEEHRISENSNSETDSRWDKLKDLLDNN